MLGIQNTAHPVERPNFQIILILSRSFLQQCIQVSNDVLAGNDIWHISIIKQGKSPAANVSQQHLSFCLQRVCPHCDDMRSICTISLSPSLSDELCSTAQHLSSLFNATFQTGLICTNFLPTAINFLWSKSHIEQVYQLKVVGIFFLLLFR